MNYTFFRMISFLRFSTVERAFCTEIGLQTNLGTDITKLLNVPNYEINTGAEKVNMPIWVH